MINLNRGQFKKALLLVLMILLWMVAIYFFCQGIDEVSIHVNNPENQEMEEAIQQIFDKRNQAIMDEDKDYLMKLYDRKVKAGLYSYEHEVRKMEYLHQWEYKQGVQFNSIDSKIFLRKLNKKGEGYFVTMAVTTEYTYQYEGGSRTNSFRLGTYHSLDLLPHEEGWMISKEWYLDPFADSLNLDEGKIEKIKEIIASHDERELPEFNERRLGALEYMDQHCGVARPPDYSFRYNSEYRNYNSLGGDCTNFASQILFEGGGFRKNSTWNYNRGGGTKAWLNAHGFNQYMLYSGRGSLIQRGTYEQVLRNSYNLLPSDYIAYEKKGEVAHISFVSALDTKGYALVNSHNSDRFRVPWEVGWSDAGITFWLVRVNY
jgi:SHS2 domain-containing protein